MSAFLLHVRIGRAVSVHAGSETSLAHCVDAFPLADFAPPKTLWPSPRQRIGTNLEVHGHGRAALAAFPEPRRPVAAGRPQAAALPAGVRIVDASVEALGVEAHRVRHPQQDHLAVLERHQTVIEVGGRHRDVLAEPERVVLVDPGVVARLGAVLAEAGEAGARILVERPALRTMVAGRRRPVERALALAPVEAGKV